MLTRGSSLTSLLPLPKRLPAGQVPVSVLSEGECERALAWERGTDKLGAQRRE